MKYTNKANIDLSIAVWLAHDTYKHVLDPYHISATTLIKSLKQIILSHRVKPEDITYDIINNVNSSMGTAFHDAIERAWIHNYVDSLFALGIPEHIIHKIVLNPDEPEKNYLDNSIFVYTEKRTNRKIGKWTISGEFDFLMEGHLTDFKSTSVWGYIFDSNAKKYSQQGSIYKWLNPNIIKDDNMTIVYLFTDWSRSAQAKKSDYPVNRVLSKQYPLESVEATDNWVKNKLNLLEKFMNLPEEDLPPCTDEDLWRKPSIWQYFKNPQGKRATKNCDSYAEAYDRYLTDGSVGIIKEKKSEVKGCEYCNAFSVCKQKDEYILDGSLVI